MPHIVLEYSDNLPALADFRALFDDIHLTLNRIGGIKIENCKSRAYAASHCYIGDGNPDNAFIHLDVEFVEGRSDEVKRSIGHECLELLQRHYQLHLSETLQITVKIEDIALDLYFKHPAGSLDYQ